MFCSFFSALPPLLVQTFGQVHGPRHDASSLELPMSYQSSCFHTSPLFSGAHERSHTASLIKVPHALLKLKLLCSIINHKKAECVLWLFRNKLRHNRKRQLKVSLVYHSLTNVSSEIRFYITFTLHLLINLSYNTEI